MNRSILNIVDFQSDTDIVLEKILSLCAVNDGEKSVNINGVVLKKGEKFDFFQPDGTLCDLDVKINFLSQVGVYNDSKSGICFTDVTGKPAVFYDQGFANAYFVTTIIDQKAFRVLRVGTVDEALNTRRIVLSRSGDSKLFIFTQSNFDTEYYYISDYSERIYKEDDYFILSNVANVLYSNNYFFNIGFTLQNIKLIYKKLI